jgi:pyruvate/2-oxoglutarate dehydrogenase complex dihydrolipoamide dehydrogenase (E3) component
MNREFDLIVIGSGPAGEAAVTVARRHKRSIALIERDKLGGDCPNVACVPTKALLRSARIFSLLQRAHEFGLRAGQADFDWGRIVARKDRIVREAAAWEEKARRYERAGVALLRGEAAFVDERHVRIGEETLRGEHILVATGSKPQIPPIEGVAEVPLLTSDEAVALTALPASLIVLGGGAVGCEFAELFATFGVRVTLIEAADDLLPNEEPEMSGVLREHLERRGVRVATGAKVERLTGDAGRKSVYCLVGKEPRAFRADEILIATGRAPRTDGLNLDAAGVETDERGQIRVNDFLRTTRPNIWAAGDVCGPHLFTHVAHYQGTRAAHNMFAERKMRAEYRVVPRVTWTQPEIAGVGMTEAEARAAGRNVAVGCADLAPLGKAQVDGEPAGRVKIIGDARTGELLGGHVAGADAGEMLHEIVGAMLAGAKVSDLANGMHAFPAFVEGIEDACCAWMDVVG